MLDGVKIKEFTQWNRVTGKMEGLIDYGAEFEVDENDDSTATEALVFMLVGLQGKVTLILYF